MRIQSDSFCIITGGPGVGKTTLIDALSARGFGTIAEDARQIIKLQIQKNGNALPWKDKKLYAEHMLEASLKSYVETLANSQEKITFFDRGVLDTIGYMVLEGIDIHPEMDKIVSEVRYNHKVFILPPWAEIYETDNERKQTWDEAMQTFEALKNTYIKYGYEVVELPKASVEERVNFILLQL